MKKFINEHPKLYWMIVGVLAVIVFSIVTAVGCAKLERAEAAETSDGVWFPTLKNADFTGCQYDWNEIMNKYQHCVVGKHSVNGNYVFCFVDDRYWSSDSGGSAFQPYVLYVRSNSWNSIESSWSIVVDSDGNVVQENRCGGLSINNSVVSNQYDVIGSTFDYIASGSSYETYVRSLPQNNIVHPRDEVVDVPIIYSYLVNAPYAVIDDFVDYNEHLNTNFTKLENDEFTVEFSLGGQPMRPENGYLLDYTLYVWLPSKLYINNHYGDFTEQYFATQCGKDKDEFTADMKTWRYGVGTNGDSVLYKLPLTYEFYNNPETEASGKYRIQLDYKDIIDYLETAYGDGENDFSFEEYYDNVNFTGYLWDFILSHMVVSRMDALVYTQIDDADTYYGRTTTFTFLRNGNFVYSEVNKDALNEDISSDMADGINNALQEGLIQSGDKVDELQQNINNVSGSLGSFDTEFEGVDLWNGIKGFGSGLIGLTGFLGNIATVLGSVFVFMPYDVRQLVGYFFMASLVVALWKLIKR